MGSDDCNGVDDALVAALAAGKTVAEAAKVAGMVERTVYRKLANPGFALRVSVCRAAMITAASGRLVEGMPEATDALRTLLKHNDPHVQYKAAVKMLELVVRVTETAELQRRLAVLEGKAISATPFPKDRPLCEAG